MNLCNTNTFLLAVFILIGHFQISGQPMGRIETFTFNESVIFPGTTRGVSVYIPAQLDKNDTACVYIQHDGLKRSEKFPRLLDSLIAAKLIPVTVGIFVEPGRLVSYNEKNRPRPNRSLEYDGLGDDHVRFLLEELLPEVARRYDLNLSDKGNDRAIGGMSSGGIAAFNAAWERPDAFSRVYCNSGSFVAFRGGDSFPTLVRKTDPKPIRFFLTTGDNDMENAAGDWTLVNHQMDKALKFSGYDYRYKVLEGGHVVGYAEHFAEAMAFLWKDWPREIRSAEGAPRVRDIILPGEAWQLVSTAYPEAGSPVSTSDGEIFFPNGKAILKIGDRDRITEHRLFRRNVTALAVGRSGLFVLTENGVLLAYDSAGRPSRLARNISGRTMAARPSGGVYISSADRLGPGTIWFMEEGREPVTFRTGFIAPVGLAIAPDHWQLAVSRQDSHWVYNYEISDNGKLLNGERFFWLHQRDAESHAGPGGLCYDRDGRLYVATNAGVQVCADNGRVVAILPLPGGTVKGVCFGGSDLDVLYAFCENGIYKRKLKPQGIGAFTPWMRMRKTEL